MIAKRILLVTLMRRAITQFGGATLVFALVVSGLLLACPVVQLPAAAQASGLEDGPPPPPPEDQPFEPPPKAGNRPSLSKRAAESADPAEPAAPVWDPLHAHKSIEVGTFYLKKGDYDAAIDRFQEATRLQPGLAQPFLLLGEAYEKKDDPADALTAYRKYLDLYHNAPDREKIQKRIEKLESQTAHQDTRHGSG
jgi:tetratricopeptide (TPR) repeat protein